MKLIILILCFTAAQASAIVYGQTINLNVENVSFEEALIKISKQSKYDLVYDSKVLKNTKPTSVYLKDASVEKALKELFRNQPLKYTLSKNTIVIQAGPFENLLEKSIEQLIQQKAISGRVTDEDGQALVGVSVRVKGGTQTASTNEDGVYSLQVNEGETIVFTYVGFLLREIHYTTQVQVDVIMKLDIMAMDEVVVVGYGTVRKSDLTGAVAQLSSQDLAQRPSINVSQGLAGRLAGVNVSTNSGRPGGRTSINIRGYSSISGGNEPLYVLDGIVLTTNINDMSPNDIESITILKDASSTAIYGTRGSNGVVLITSKKGKQHIPNISYNGYTSLGKLPNERKLNVLNSSEWLYLEELAFQNAQKFDPLGFASGKYSDPIKKRMDYLVGNENGMKELFTLDDKGGPVPLYDVDWQDLVFGTAFSQNHNLSFSGRGDEKSNYSFSAGYAKEQGIMAGSQLRKINFRGLFERQMTDRIKMGAMLMLTDNLENRTDGDVDGNNALRQTVEMVPFIPYKYQDGSYGYRSDYSGLENGDNPLAQLHEISNQYGDRNFNGNIYAAIDLWKGLKFTSTLGTNLGNGANKRYFSKETYLENGVGKNYAGIFNNESSFWQWSNRFNYALMFNGNLLDATLGAERQEFHSNIVGSSTTMFDDYFKWNSLGTGEVPLPPSSSTNSYQMLSFFGRTNYSHQSKYLLTLTGRFDGSSKFGAENKFAFFPSVGLGWVVSKESFLEDNRIISNLKLRTSFGLTGNSEIGSYRSLANLSTSTTTFGGNRAIGTIVGSMANPVLQWEKTRQFDIGIDIGFINDRISIVTDYFNKYTYDMLLNAPLPATSGYTSVTRNIGNMRNSGIELSINSINVSTEDISWSTNFNVTFLKNRVLGLGLSNDDIIYGKRNAQILRVGESVGSFYGYIRDGIWATVEESKAATYNKKPGDLKILDINNDGAITADDRTILGKGIPDFIGGFSTSFQYKNLDFVLELQYSLGNEVFNDQRATGEARFGLANNFRSVLTDSWTLDRQDANLEQVRPYGAGYGYYVDTRRVTDGSFLRGKNIGVGYTISNSGVAKLGLKKARMFLSVQNFFLLTSYWAYDPEVSTYDDVFAQGVTFASYPKPRLFMFGVNIGL